MSDLVGNPKTSFLTTRLLLSWSTANITSIIYHYGSVKSRNSRSTATLHSINSVDSNRRDFGITPFFYVITNTTFSCRNKNCMFNECLERLCDIFLYKFELCHEKTNVCICENKDADQLIGYREDDQRLCFPFIDSTIPLLSKCEISSLKSSSVAVQPGLSRTRSETRTCFYS